MTITTATPNPFAGVEMKQANRARKHLPGGGELAGLIRDGVTVPELVARFDSSKTSIYTRLRDSGYGPDGMVPVVSRTPRVAPLFELLPEEWTAGAECAKPGTDPDLWHSDGPGSRFATRAAKAVCAGCPVALECLRYALRMDALTEGRSHGVYGGLTADERAELVKGAK